MDIHLTMLTDKVVTSFQGNNKMRRNFKHLDCYCTGYLSLQMLYILAFWFSDKKKTPI